MQVILAETIMTQLLLSLSLTPRIGNVIDSILGYEGEITLGNPRARTCRCD